jgi:methionine-rich copper-binding protein CopC
MKNLKKLLAVIVAVCVLATMTVPAFAAASDAEICEALGILQGDGAGVTDTYLAKGTERYQAAIIYLRLIGKEEEAKAFTGEDNFDDADQIYKGGQRILAYLKANPDLGWTGVGGNKFEPTNPASAQMIYKVLLEALGYKQDVDFKWAETLDFAESVGLSAIADIAELTNADVATALVEGLKAKVKDSDATLAEKLVADGIIDEAVAAEYGLVELVPATLEVVSVSADNLKEVVVVFNQPVDGDTVNADNIKVDGKTGSVALQDDGVTAVITIDGDGLENQADYKAVIEKVKAADGTEIAKTEKSFKAFDATLPVAEKITVTGPKNFTITFSEPIKKGEDGVEVKSGTSVIGVNPSFGTGGRDVTVDLYSSLADGKTYEITVKNFEDYAGYKNVVKTFSLAYAKDNSAPTATVEKVDQKYVVVKFNKPVTGLIKEMFWHTFTAWKALGIYSDEAMTTAIEPTHSVDTVWVKFANAADDGKPIAEGTTRFGILGKTTNEGGTSYEIKDNWDNKFETTEFTITVTADKVAPEVTELTVDSEESLKVVFSEAVNFSPDNVEIYDADGKTIDGVTVGVSDLKDGKEWKITLGENLAGETIVVRIKDVTDKALQANKMSTYTTTITITDVTGPVVDKVTFKTETKDNEEVATLYVFFNEDVDGSGTNKANYATLDDGKLVTLSNDPSFFDGNKVVKVDLTADEWENVQGDGLYVMKIKDVLGNETAGQTIKHNEMVGYETDKPEVEEIEVVAADKVVIKFNQFLKRVDSAAFKVNSTTPAAMELSEKDGKTVVTLYVNTDEEDGADEILADASNVEVVIDASDNDVKVLNIFDLEPDYTEFDAESDEVKDKIAPSVDKDGSYVYTGSEEIVLKYDEAIEAASVSILTYEVEGFKVDEVEVSEEDKTVTITVKKENFNGFEVNAKVKVTQEYPVVGKDGNKSKFDSIEITVTAEDASEGS